MIWLPTWTAERATAAAGPCILGGVFGGDGSVSAGPHILGGVFGGVFGGDGGVSARTTTGPSFVGGDLCGRPMLQTDVAIHSVTPSW